MPGNRGRTSGAASTQVTTEGREDEDAEANDRPGVFIDFTIAKARTTVTLDRETLLLTASALAAERPQILDEIARIDPKQKITLGELLRKYVTRQSLSQETGLVLMELLKKRGLLVVQASPTMFVRDNQKFEIRTLSEEWFTLPGENGDTGAEPALKKVDYGTVIRGTPHIADGRSITLEMAATFTEPAGPTPAGGLPIVRTMEVATTVITPSHQYFSLLVDPSHEKDAQAQNPESLLVMFVPGIVEPVPAPPDEPAAQASQAGKRPRQVLLDTRVVVVERDDLRNVGVEWSFPTIRADQPLDDSGWLKSVQIGYSPGQAGTESLLATLILLEQMSRADVVAHPAIVAQDGRQAQLRSVQEEWFLISNPDRAGAELQKIDSGTILTMTPHVGDHDEITLEMAVEISQGIPRGTASDLPIVTRRLAKNSVTIEDGGTVAVAGLAESFLVRNRPSKEVAIFVTARLMPETQPPRRGQTSVNSPAISTAQPAPPKRANTQQAGITASFTDMDLLKALARISALSGAKIAVDLTVKPQPITAELANASVPAAIQQILQGTRYTFQITDEGNAPTYLVHRPLTGKYEGVDLTQALQDIAADAGVPIVPDANVHGRIWVHFEDVPLEQALTLVLAGKPYLFKKTPHYYLVAARPGTESGISAREIVAAWERHVNSDPMVRELSESIARTERDLIVLRQTRTDTHPDVAQKEALLKAFRDRLQQRRDPLEEEFEASLAAARAAGTGPIRTNEWAPGRREAEEPSDSRPPAPAPSEDQGRSSTPEEAPSRAWAIMQQWNSPRLLQGLGPRLAKLLEPERRADPAWLPVTVDGRVLFEDGSPAVSQPAPWEGAKTTVRMS